MSQNPYQKIYDDLNIAITSDTTLEQAETLARHLGYLYNTFGLMVKDFIALLGQRFRHEHAFPNDRNKKHHQNTNLPLQNHQSINSHHKIQQPQLEGKISPAAPNILIHQIQNYNQPKNASSTQHQLPTLAKSNHLNNIKNHTYIENSSNLEKEHLNNPVYNLLAHTKNPQTQTKDSTEIKTNNTSENPEDKSEKKVIPRKRRDHEVINISSEDDQKQEDSLSGVKTRAQKRGDQKSMMRPDSLLKRGRGRGRARRGRPSSKSSSRIEENNDDEKKSFSPYLSHPNDPFTVIHNVPYRGPANSQKNGSAQSTPSKKDQKMDKKFNKQNSESSYSQKEFSSNQQQRDELYQNKNQSPDREKNKNRNPSENSSNNRKKRSPYHNESFIKKVMTSYLHQKRQIRDKLENLEREYDEQRHNQSPSLNQGNNNERKQALNISHAIEDDGYEYEIEEEVSFEHFPQQEDNFGDDGDVMVEQQEEQEQALPFQKLNPSPKPSPRPQIQQDHHQNSYSYLQQINQSIQQQFEQNLRMNHQINDSNEYEQEISYSPSNYLIQEQQQPQVIVNTRSLEQHYEVQETIEAQQGEILFEKQSGKVIQDNQRENEMFIDLNQKEKKMNFSQNERQNREFVQQNLNQAQNLDNAALFDSLFQYQRDQQQQNHQQTVQLNLSTIEKYSNPEANPYLQRKLSNTPSNQSHQQVSMEQQHMHSSSPIPPQQMVISSRKNSQLSQSQKPIAPTESYFPFLQGVPNPEKNQLKSDNEVASNQIRELPIQQNVTNNKQLGQGKLSDKEELLKVLDAFQSDEQQPKRGLFKPTVNPNLRQALIDKLKSLNPITTTINSTTISIQKSPQSNHSLQNNSLHENKHLFSFSSENKSPSRDQEKTTTGIKQTTTTGLNGLTKPVQQSIIENKKQVPSEFVSIIKKTKYIEVIELQ